MTFALDREGFREWVFGLTTLTQSNSVIWSRDPNPFISPVDQCVVKLKVRARPAMMVDETRYDGDVTQGTYIESTYGVRSITITIRVENFNAGQEASDVLEQIRTNMWLQSPNAALNALNMSILDVSGMVAADYVVDEREVNMCQADFSFNMVSSQSITQVGGGWIDSVNTGNIVPITYGFSDPTLAPACLIVSSFACSLVVT